MTCYVINIAMKFFNAALSYKTKHILFLEDDLQFVFENSAAKSIHKMSSNINSTLHIHT